MNLTLFKKICHQIVFVTESYQIIFNLIKLLKKEYKRKQIYILQNCQIILN